MHNCGLCGKTSQPGETANRVVMETRPKQYDVPINHGRRRNPLSFKEIVREILACGKCASDPSRVKKVGSTLVATSEFQFLTSTTARRENYANA